MHAAIQAQVCRVHAQERPGLQPPRAWVQGQGQAQGLRVLGPPLRQAPVRVRVRVRVLVREDSKRQR